MAPKQLHKLTPLCTTPSVAEPTDSNPQAATLQNAGRGGQIDAMRWRGICAKAVSAHRSTFVGTCPLFDRRNVSITRWVSSPLAIARRKSRNVRPRAGRAHRGPLLLTLPSSSDEFPHTSTHTQSHMFPPDPLSHSGRSLGFALWRRRHTGRRCQWP